MYYGGGGGGGPVIFNMTQPQYSTALLVIPILCAQVSTADCYSHGLRSGAENPEAQNG